MGRLLPADSEGWVPEHFYAEVLGVLIARAAGVPLGRFFQERIFEPLGMRDTDFSVPAAKRDRFATGYFAANPFDPDVAGVVLNDPADGQWSKPPAFPSGGAGLVSTVDDYLAFARMLLAGGTSTNGSGMISSPAAFAALLM